MKHRTFVKNTNTMWIGMLQKQEQTNDNNVRLTLYKRPVMDCSIHHHCRKQVGKVLIGLETNL